MINMWSYFDSNIRIEFQLVQYQSEDLDSSIQKLRFKVFKKEEEVNLLIFFLVVYLIYLRSRLKRNKLAF